MLWQNRPKPWNAVHIESDYINNFLFALHINITLIQHIKS